MELPLPIAGEVLAWHYTDASGLLGIVRSNAIWATSPDALNDTTELQHGLDVLRGVLDERRQSDDTGEGSHLRRLLLEDVASERAAASVFVTSASADGDALNQWQHYAREGGFAIGFSSPTASPAPIALLQPLAQHDGRPTVEPLWPNMPVPLWLRVLYEEAEQREAAGRLVDFAIEMLSAGARDPAATSDDAGTTALYSSRISSVALALVCCMKHTAFSAEKEIRPVSFPSAPGVFELHRLVDGNFAPSIELAAQSEQGRARLPIRSIRVGQSAERARLGLRRLLDSYGYKDVEILSSEVPIR